MPKVSRVKLKPESWDRFQNDFWRAVAMLSTVEEVKRFFFDLLTPTEIKMLSKRIEAAKLLMQDKNYDQIKKELGLGNSTIANVHNWLNVGSGGLRDAADRLNRIEGSR